MPIRHRRRRSRRVLRYTAFTIFALVLAAGLIVGVEGVYEGIASWWSRLINR